MRKFVAILLLFVSLSVYAGDISEEEWMPDPALETEIKMTLLQNT